MLGAGPKGLAIAMRNAVRRSIGDHRYDVVLLERARVAHHWRESGGWTDGQQTLGTSPLKDLGFPYEPTQSADDRTLKGLLEYSWLNYLAECGQLSRWTDRGSPNPTHAQWADYLSWAAYKSDAQIRPCNVLEIDHDGSQFELRDDSSVLRADRIVTTGFGPSDRRLSSACLSVADFWRTESMDARFSGKKVAVVGSGETAASIVQSLVQRSTPGDILVISPSETIYSRGESYLENRLYSSPDDWTALTIAQRRSFIRRTDRSVFSQSVQSSLSALGLHRHLQGKVTDAVRVEESVIMSVVNDAERQAVRADAVIDARGGDATWFTSLFSKRLSERLAFELGEPFSHSSIETRIARDLSVHGITPRIHVPNSAALAQGPGFPNLSSLGSLAARILDEDSATDGLGSQRQEVIAA